jgi:hypothetical protein
MKLVTFNGIKFILTSDTSEALGELHRQMPAIMADVTGMRDSQSGDQKYFNRQDSWDIKQLHGDTTVTFYSKLVSKGKKLIKEFSIIRESSSPSLGLVYELGSRTDEGIITEGFFVSPTLDWYTPSILIGVNEDDGAMIPLYTSTLNVEELKGIPVHNADEGEVVTGPGLTCGPTGCNVPTGSDDPDIFGYSGFYENDDSLTTRVVVNGITLYYAVYNDYYRFDWWFECLGGGREDYYGWSGEITWNNTTNNNYSESSGGVYGSDIVDWLDWPENRAWYYVTDRIFSEVVYGEASGVFEWSSGWIADLILGTCTTDKDATGVPWWIYAETNRQIIIKVPSEVENEVLEFIIWDAAVGPYMIMPGLSVRLYAYQGLPVYILVQYLTVVEKYL